MYSVVTVVGEKKKDVVICDVVLSQGRSETTLDRAHRVSSIERRHLEQFNAVIGKSVTKRANSRRGKADVSLSSLKWLQAVLKSEAKVFCGRTLIVTLWSSYRTSTNSLASPVTSDSWDEDGTTSSLVGSTLMVRIGRGLSRRTVRNGQVTGVPPYC